MRTINLKSRATLPGRREGVRALFFMPDNGMSRANSMVDRFSVHL